MRGTWSVARFALMAATIVVVVVVLLAFQLSLDASWVVYAIVIGALLAIGLQRLASMRVRRRGIDARQARNR